MLLVGVVWGGYADTHPPETPEYQTVIVPDTQYKTRTVEVDKPPSQDCKYYMDAVNTVLRGQKLLSQTKGKQQEMLDQQQINAFFDDPKESTRLTREMYELQNQMNNSWRVIGDGQSQMQVLEEKNGGNPCLK